MLSKLSTFVLATSALEPNPPSWDTDHVKVFEPNDLDAQSILDQIHSTQGGMDPINKWYLQLFFPFGLLVVFFLWYRCLPPKSIAKSTVKEASIQVGFVWLFETIVTSSLKSLDCTPGTPGKLIMNPEQDCPLSGGNAGIAMLGILVLGAYVVAPYVWLASHRSFGFCAGCFSNTRKCYQGKGCCACCIEGVVLSGQTYYTPERCSKVRVGGLVGKLYFANEM